MVRPRLFTDGPVRGKSICLDAQSERMLKAIVGDQNITPSEAIRRAIKTQYQLQIEDATDNV